MDRLDRVGLEDLMLQALSGQIAGWWWLIALVFAVAFLQVLASGKRSRRSRRSRRYRRKGRAGRTAGRQRHAGSRSASVAQPGQTISGKAYVTDGDGIRVAGQEVRFIGLDAPEWDQYAEHQDGYWFNHGKHVKSALIQQIGGKHVHVSVEDTDQYGRLLGTVIYRGRDIGEWLVGEGHAIAAYSDRYKRVERAAREARRGMWAHARNIDPRAWRRTGA